MSRNGASLADWQDIYNGVNERRKATMFWSQHASQLLPVPFSENHITHNDASGLVGIPSGFCDPSTPLTFQTWNDQYDTGSEPNGINSLGDGSPMNIFRYVPQYGSYPKAGCYLAGSGWFLDWMDDALGYMTKAASAFYPSAVQHKSRLQWYEYGTYDMPPGSVWDGVTGDWIPGLTISSYTDLWDYAVQNLHEIDNYDSIDAWVSTGNDIVNIQYSSCKVPHPGVIPADLTLYYSATGDNLGYTPTNYTQGGVNIHGYTTSTLQNASQSTSLYIGFTSMVIPSSAPLPGYNVQETLDNFYAVWDFAPYFQY